MQKTPFYNYHIDHHAKMVEFAGYQLPLHFGSVVEEHQAVRTGTGMFDVSHMGRVEFSGRGARRLLERVCTRALSSMEPMTCRYSMVCNPTGGVMDDVIVYRFEDRWMMVCNAANREKLLAHFEAQRGELAVNITDMTTKWAMVALQGPKVMDMIGRFSSEVPSLKRYRFAMKNLLVMKLIISRTGYTGEDGVEVILPAGASGMALKLFMSKTGGEGQPTLRPCGLGARDTLRLEAGMPLYGHELDERTDPLAAGLNFAVALDKEADESTDDGEAFIGQNALRQIAEQGPTKTLVGLTLEGRRSPRQGMTVRRGDTAVGQVTSGCLSPTLGYPIAMAYVDVAQGEPGTMLNLQLGKTAADAKVVTLPFYQKS